MSEFNMLDNLGVDVPCKIVKLSKPPSAFIAEAGDSLASWQRGRNKVNGNTTQAAGMPTHHEERSVGRRCVRSSSASASSSSLQSEVRERGGSGAASSTSGAGQQWRQQWRPHAHPMQRSHFSVANPSSLALDTDAEPVASNAPPMPNHRRPIKKGPTDEPPGAVHPLEAHHYAKEHSKTQRRALSNMPINAASAAGAPSAKITRAPIPSDVDSLHTDPEAPSQYTRPAARVAGPKIWTEERDRKDREREHRGHRAEVEAAAAAAPREKVLTATSPQRNVVTVTGPTERLWLPERQRRDDNIAQQNAHVRPLNHMHKKLWDPEPQSSPQRPGQVGTQKSSLQQHLRAQGWWSQGENDRPEVETKLNFVAPTSPQPSFALPNFSKTHFEGGGGGGGGAGGSFRRRSLSPAASRGNSRPASFRQWKP